MFACYGALVRAYDLSSPWDIDTLSYDTEVSVSAQVVSAQGLAFSYDGTKMYVLSYSSSPLLSKILQYSLTTAWDITTASYVKQMLLTSYDSRCTGGMSFSPDGTKLYVVGNTTGDVHQFTLSTAWDIGSTSYVGYKYFSFLGSDAIYFRPNGTSVYLIWGSYIEKRNLSVAWDISTMSQYPSGQFNAVHEISNPNALFFKPDGSKMYVSTNAIYSYDFV